MIIHSVGLPINKKSSKSRPREGDDASPDASNTQPSKRFRTNGELNDVDPTAPPSVSFDQAFLDLGRYGHYIPLALFTNNNIEFLNNNSISFHRTKISHIEGKPQILDLADVIKKLKGSRDGGPTQNLDLEHFEWLEATASFFVYQSLLYAEGDEANEPQFYKKHFSFFENQPNSNKKTVFDLFDYRTEWGRVKSRFAALETCSSNSSAQPSSSTCRSRFLNSKGPKTHDAPPTTFFLRRPQTSFRLATRIKPPATLVASSAGALVTPSLTATPPTVLPTSGQSEMGRSSYTQPVRCASAPTGTSSPPAPRSAQVPAMSAFFAVDCTLHLDGTPAVVSRPAGH